MEYYNRYTKLSGNGGMKLMPGIQIPEKATDKMIAWNKQLHRMDILSQKYYQTPTEGYLIMMANMQYGTDEFDIPDGALIRIPYPYKASLQSFIDEMNKYESKFGL
jgi:hypothetical protein